VSAAGVRSFLERHALLARRDLGQNFLFDEGLARRLADLAGVDSGDTVVEIGTGLGTLTRALAERAARVVTLEVDAGLVRALRAESMLPESVELIHTDVLRFDLAALVRAAKPPVRVVASLPYSIGAPVERQLLDLRADLADWSIMLQREVADRLRAAPGSRAYGSLSVLHALSVELTKTMALEPACFYPVPRVRSTFLRVTPLARPAVFEQEFAWVERVARAAFSQRRKTLANALRSGALDPPPSPSSIELALERLGVPLRVRAEHLSPGQFLDLSRSLAGQQERVR
jgi:16S rRNA (adenine1518-N6/adenine1519-N6)-dimethyltransferase